jgi:chromosome partitioning protein
MTRPRTRLSRQIDDALAEYGMPTLKARTTERVSYPQAAIEGSSVLEGRDQTARNEIIAIRGEVERLSNDTA